MLNYFALVLVSPPTDHVSCFRAAILLGWDCLTVSWHLSQPIWPQPYQVGELSFLTIYDYNLYFVHIDGVLNSCACILRDPFTHSPWTLLVTGVFVRGRAAVGGTQQTGKEMGEPLKPYTRYADSHRLIRHPWQPWRLMSSLRLMTQPQRLLRRNARILSHWQGRGWMPHDGAWTCSA